MKSRRNVAIKAQEDRTFFSELIKAKEKYMFSNGSIIERTANASLGSTEGGIIRGVSRTLTFPINRSANRA